MQSRSYKDSDGEPVLNQPACQIGAYHSGRTGHQNIIAQVGVRPENRHRLESPQFRIHVFSSSIIFQSRVLVCPYALEQSKPLVYPGKEKPSRIKLNLLLFAKRRNQPADYHRKAEFKPLLLPSSPFSFTVTRFFGPKARFSGRLKRTMQCPDRIL